jgi:hypothetical protein
MQSWTLKTYETNRTGRPSSARSGGKSDEAGATLVSSPTQNKGDDDGDKPAVWDASARLRDASLQPQCSDGQSCHRLKHGGRQ